MPEYTPEQRAEIERRAALTMHRVDAMELDYPYGLICHLAMYYEMTRGQRPPSPHPAQPTEEVAALRAEVAALRLALSQSDPHHWTRARRHREYSAAEKAAYNAGYDNARKHKKQP